MRREPSGGRDECPGPALARAECVSVIVGANLHPVDRPVGGRRGSSGTMTTTAKREGPSYFGFVKDTNGSTMPDVEASGRGIKDRGGVVTRTDALGAYKVPGFGKEVDPKDVEIACDKQGYKQIRILLRMRSPTADVRFRSRPSARFSASRVCPVEMEFARAAVSVCSLPPCGEGWGGGSLLLCEMYPPTATPTPTPNPSPTASRACPTCALKHETRASPGFVGRGAHRVRGKCFASSPSRHALGSSAMQAASSWPRLRR